MSLTSDNFRRLMTTHTGHRIWQDLHHAKTVNGADVYLKRTVIGEIVFWGCWFLKTQEHETGIGTHHSVALDVSAKEAA